MLRNHYETTLQGVRLWTGDMDVEQLALQLFRNLSTLPILVGHIAVMPDVHFGMGATVGEAAVAMARALARKNEVHLPDRDLAWLDQGTPEPG